VRRSLAAGECRLHILHARGQARELESHEDVLAVAVLAPAAA